LHADLVGGSVIDVKGPSTPANIDAERFPRERLLEDALAQVAGEEKTVRAIRPKRSEEP
jgi:hypothetical protein